MRLPTRWKVFWWTMPKRLQIILNGIHILWLNAKIVRLKIYRWFLTNSD